MPQLVGIDAHLDVGVGPAYGEPGVRPLHGLAEFRVELFGPGGQRQALQARPLPPGQPLHIVDDAAHPLGVGADDLGQPPVFLGQLRRFRQQLSGVAHGSYGVADLVGDAGAQASQGCELGLLHLLAEEAGVLQEDQQRPRVPGTQGREVRPDHARTVGGDERRVHGGQCRAHTAALAPGLQ